VQHTAQLTHPNTVAIFDYGKSPDGVFYYAMELLDGVDLETLVKREGPQPAARVIHIVRQVCGALDEAHAMGLIHRDVKPANVLLCLRGRTPDVAKVVDFGLVKELAPREQDQSMAQVVTGTPAYIAPEAVVDPAQLGPASDLYALGAVAYYLLTGERLFTAKTSVDMCIQHVSAVPVPPSQRTKNPIPPGLEAIILQCLAKQPAARPTDARALAASLAALPEATAWDEESALAWWKTFERKPSVATAAGKAKAHAQEHEIPSITVDLAGRSGSAQARLTGQAMK
jgi:serine/threonine-protein kinase